MLTKVGLDYGILAPLKIMMALMECVFYGTISGFDAACDSEWDS